MSQATKQSENVAAEQGALRQRVKRMYDSLNHEQWEKCYSLIDPRLREGAKVNLGSYAERLQSFKRAYGLINPWHTRLSLHLDGSSNKHDPRPFAYVYVVWQDANHEFHMFKDRWVRDAEGWFTRVVGLVTNLPESRRGEG